MQQRCQTCASFVIEHVQGDSSDRGLRWVDLNFERSAVGLIPPGNLAEAVEQMGKKMERQNQSQPNPGQRPDEWPCILG